MAESKASRHRKKEKPKKSLNRLARRGIIKRAMDNLRATRENLLEHNPDFFRDIRARLGRKNVIFFERPAQKEFVIVDAEKNREAVKKFMNNVPEEESEFKTKVKAILEQQENSIH
ncbi:MAG: hypothetical protein OEY94_00960 [Alphaproteobacteria bacterium]|nr:hypothetical protein [Alphaproteobacteria bacterium]